VCKLKNNLSSFLHILEKEKGGEKMREDTIFGIMLLILGIIILVAAFAGLWEIVLGAN